MKALAKLLDLLRRMHDSIRDQVVAVCEERPAEELTRVAHDGAGDVTYLVDKVSENAVVEWLSREIAEHEPIVLIAEGIPGGQVTLPDKAVERDARWRIIVDPIDGTRGFMYQKRPGWILTGVAPNHGENTSLTEIELAIQTEIPLLKQHLCDQLWAIRGQGAHGVQVDRLTKQSRPLALQPSTAADLEHGFATICRYFPGARDVLAAIDDELCKRVLNQQNKRSVAVFEDQTCSGAQIYGLATGQDRFVADLRPLVQPLIAARGGALGHCCHPYDICTKLIAEEAGAIITDPTGGPIRASLDIHENVAWVGYANRQLKTPIEPVLRELLREYGLMKITEATESTERTG